MTFQTSRWWTTAVRSQATVNYNIVFLLRANRGSQQWSSCLSLCVFHHFKKWVASRKGSSIPRSNLRLKSGDSLPNQIGGEYIKTNGNFSYISLGQPQRMNYSFWGLGSGVSSESQVSPLAFGTSNRVNPNESDSAVPKLTTRISGSHTWETVVVGEGCRLRVSIIQVASKTSLVSNVSCWHISLCVWDRYLLWGDEYLRAIRDRGQPGNLARMSWRHTHAQSMDYWEHRAKCMSNT